MTQDNDYYEVLGVSPDATEDEIRKAFRERVRACHPDRVANLDADLKQLAEEKMVQLNEAYAVLRNPARRAAYDDRHSAGGRTVPAEAPPESPPAAATPHASPSRSTLRNPVEARNRIGEQEFVARAASEEFEQEIKQCVAGRADWTPVALGGTTLALRAAQGRNNFYFVLLAAPQLDEKRLRRFLKKLESCSAKLKPGLWSRNRVFGFAAAVEFTGPDRLRKLVDQFNDRRSDKSLGQATLIDLVNWHVVPGETSLGARLSTLMRGG